MADYEHIDLLKSMDTSLESILAAGEVTTIDITAIGAVDDDTVVSDPEALSATVVGLLRGILTELQAANVLLESIATNTA